jgi:hypothetical protein
MFLTFIGISFMRSTSVILTLSSLPQFHILIDNNVVLETLTKKTFNVGCVVIAAESPSVNFKRPRGIDRVAPLIALVVSFYSLHINNRIPPLSDAADGFFPF